MSDIAAVLASPGAQALLTSRIPARLAFTGLDGAPRVVPIWFHWNGREVVMFSHAASYKARAIARAPRVAVTIDTEAWPYRVLWLRGEASLSPVPAGQVLPEADAATSRYLGEEAARAFAQEKATEPTVRIALRPDHARLQEL